MCFAYLSEGLSLCLDQFDPRLAQLFGMGEGQQVGWLISLEMANQFNKRIMRLKRVLKPGFKKLVKLFYLSIFYLSVSLPEGNFFLQQLRNATLGKPAWQKL